jgi:hypothetical protein
MRTICDEGCRGEDSGARGLGCVTLLMWQITVVLYRIVSVEDEEMRCSAFSPQILILSLTNSLRNSLGKQKPVTLADALV